jgi:thiol:disulfide interchange protein
VTFDPGSDEVLVRGDSQLAPERLLQAVEAAGYRARVAPRRADGPPAAAVAPTWFAEELPEPVRSALLRVRREGRAVLIDFSARWCAPCQRFAQETLASAEVARVLDRFVVLTVDADEHLQAARAFDVRALPSVRLLRSDGVEVTRLERFVDAAELLPLLAAVEGQERGLHARDD